MAKAPAFQFYPKDYESDENVKLMTLAQEGLYLRLLCHQWIHGSIPDDVSQLARIARTSPREAKKLWPGVHMCFEAGDGGRLVNPRLDRERKGQETRRKERAESGSKGGSAKAKAKQDASSATDQLVAKASPASATASATASTTASPVELASSRAGADSEPASLTQGCLAYDPGRPWERDLAHRCLELALKIVEAGGREHVTEEDRRAALEAATATAQGRVARQVGGLPREWAEVSIAQAAAFEAENFGS